jgi:hypothetical protein
MRGLRVHRTWPGRGLPVLAIPVRLRDPDRLACLALSDDRCQLIGGLLLRRFERRDHFSPPRFARAAGGELIQQRGELSPHLDHRARLAQLGRKPSVLGLQLGDLLIARVTSSGSALGRPGSTPNARSAPLSRCCRQLVINDEYKPSRRSNAPLPALSSCSYSSKIRFL